MVSIIIPIYNVELYLEQCLISVQNQTMRDIEIILVNDGSTDGSLEILKKYAVIDSRIIIIDKANEGPALARDSGLSVAKGDFVAFVDADDWIEPDMIQIMYDLALKNSLELVIANYILEFTNQSQINTYSMEIMENYSRKNYLLYHVLSGNFPPFLWICLYKKSFLKDNKFFFNSKINGLEDFLFTTEVLTRTNNIYILDCPFYHYRMRKSAITRKADSKFVKKQANLMICVVEFLKSNNLLTFSSKKAFYQYFFRMWPGMIKKIVRNNEISFKQKYKQIQWFLNHDFVDVLFEENYNLTLGMKKSIDRITIKYKLIIMVILFGYLRKLAKTNNDSLFD